MILLSTKLWPVSHCLHFHKNQKTVLYFVYCCMTVAQGLDRWQKIVCLVCLRMLVFVLSDWINLLIFFSSEFFWITSIQNVWFEFAMTSITEQDFLSWCQLALICTVKTTVRYQEVCFYKESCQCMEQLVQLCSSDRGPWGDVNPGFMQCWILPRL